MPLQPSKCGLNLPNFVAARGPLGRTSTLGLLSRKLDSVITCELLAHHSLQPQLWQLPCCTDVSSGLQQVSVSGCCHACTCACRLRHPLQTSS
jgi:hypothetical protein